MADLKNRTKLGKDTGSVMNYLMGNNNTAPEVGKGATVMLHTDRHAYQVLHVSKDGKRIKMQRCKATRIDNNGMSESQQYDYSELEGKLHDYVYRNGAWRIIVKQIVYTDDFCKKLDNDEFRKNNTDDIWNKKTGELRLVEGKTRVQTTYPKIHILFGVQREYYDYSF